MEGIIEARLFHIDPVIVMLPLLTVLHDGSEDMRCSPASNTMVILDWSGPLHR